MFKCIAVYDGQYVGADRVLADGVDCAYICDIAIHPEFQGQGLGKHIVSELLKLSMGHKKSFFMPYPVKRHFIKNLALNV